MSSVYWACVSAPVGLLGLGGAAGGVNVPIGCTVRATGTKTTGETVNTDMVIGPVLKQELFKFPPSFNNLAKINFVLVATSIVSGIADVDFDSASYTLYRSC